MSEQQQPQSAPVRVLVVDDQQLMREGIASLLRIQDGIEIIGTAANGQEALEQAMSLQPDVILMDVPSMTRNT
jgi:YesN/AraC family two-component response regulator